MEKILQLYKKYKEMINYLIVGGLTTVIALGSKWGLLFTILDQTNALQLQIAIVISWILGVLFSYFASRIFVFESKTKKILKEFISFLASRFSTLLLDMFIMWFFVTLLKLNSDTYVLIFTMISQVLVIIANYVLSKLFVFKKADK